MITYTALSSHLPLTYLTGSDFLHKFLVHVQASYCTVNKVALPSWPQDSDSFIDSGTPVNVSSTYCVVRNPYYRFISRWVRNSAARQKNNLTPYTFAEYITEYNNIHFVNSLNGQGLWETKTINHIDFGPISVQISSAGYTASMLKVLKLESILDDVKTVPHVDITNAEQLAAYNTFIVNGAAKLDEYPTWKTLYDQSKADIIYNAFAGDFAAFGYAQDSWK